MVTPFTESSYELENPETGIAYEVTVEPPNRYATHPDKSYPIVICLDGLWTYGPVRDAFRILSLGRELPEAVVVGVGHAHPDLREVLQLRAIDFTPTEFNSPPETGVQLPADQVGRAANFRRFLVDTILPSVAERYRITDDRTLVGHSFSALFGLDTLLNEPEAFNRWVLTSPSVWWDNRVMFRREDEHAAVADDLHGRVFLSVGSDESIGEPSEGFVGFGGQQEIYERLASRAYPSLDLTWCRFPGETHQSVISGAVVRGLRSVH